MTQLTGGGRTIFLIVMELTRKRSDTVLTVHSDSHDQKKLFFGRDTRGYIITVVYLAEYVKFHCISLI